MGRDGGPRIEIGKREKDDITYVRDRVLRAELEARDCAAVPELICPELRRARLVGGRQRADIETAQRGRVSGPEGGGGAGVETSYLARSALA